MSFDTIRSIDDAYFNKTRSAIRCLDAYLTVNPDCNEAGTRDRINIIKESAAQLFSDYAAKIDKNDPGVVGIIIQNEYSLYVDLIRLCRPGKLLTPDIIRKLIFSPGAKTIDNLAKEVPLAQALTAQFVSKARVYTGAGAFPDKDPIQRKITAFAGEAIRIPYTAPYGQKEISREDFFSMRRKSFEVLTEIMKLDQEVQAADDLITEAIFGPVEEVVAARPAGVSEDRVDEMDPFDSPEQPLVPPAPPRPAIRMQSPVPVQAADDFESDDLFGPDGEAVVTRPRSVSLVPSRPAVRMQSPVQADYPAHLNPFDDANGQNKQGNPFDDDEDPFDDAVPPAVAMQPDAYDKPMTGKQIGKEACGNVRWMVEDRFRKRPYVKGALIVTSILAGYFYGIGVGVAALVGGSGFIALTDRIRRC